MRLNDKLTTSFEYENNEYAIDLAFDNVLDAFDVLGEESLREYEKAKICLALLLDEQEYEPSIEMWNYILENFINSEKKQAIEYDRMGNPMPPREEEDDGVKHIDLDVDAEHIYASFRQAYNINLFNEQGKMHWQEFQALLNGLPSNTVMQRIIQIRLWKPSKGDSDEYKNDMRKLQKVYSLQANEGVEE